MHYCIAYIINNLILNWFTDYKTVYLFTRVQKLSFSKSN